MGKNEPSALSSSREDSPAENETLFRYLASLTHNNEDARQELTAHLCRHYGSLAALLCARPADWEIMPKRTDGLVVLCAILKELAHRYGHALLPEGDLLEQPQLLRDYLMARMARERVEQFRLLFLDGKNRLILEELQGQGTINHAPVYPREVAKRCMELRAAGLIMVHNHPAGQTTPSRGDVIMTQKIEQALKVIKVVLVDHFIITRKAQTSFRQLGLLSPS